MRQAVSSLFSLWRLGEVTTALLERASRTALLCVSAAFWRLLGILFIATYSIAGDGLTVLFFLGGICNGESFFNTHASVSESHWSLFSTSCSLVYSLAEMLSILAQLNYVHFITKHGTTMVHSHSVF